MQLDFKTTKILMNTRILNRFKRNGLFLTKNIAERVFQNPCYVQDEYYKLMKPKKNYTKYKVYKYKGNLKDTSKMSGIDVLFILLFHLLGLIPKRENYKPLSPEMKQEVIKIETQMKKAQEDITKTKKKDRNLNR